jgi:uncharacterized OB-fold protein
MKLTFTVTYLTPAGKETKTTVEIGIADFAAWERKTKRKVQDLQAGMGIDDMTYLCWHRITKNKIDARDYETWLESVQQIEAEGVEASHPTAPAPSDDN